MKCGGMGKGDTNLFLHRGLRHLIPQLYFVFFAFFLVTVNLLICIFLDSQVSFVAYHYKFNEH